MNLSHSSADAAATVTHSSVLRRTSQAQALFWPLCALLLSVCVVLALPGQRVALGASQLKGLVGSYTGHGNWLITVTTAGSATWQLNHSPDVRYGDVATLSDGAFDDDARAFDSSEVRLRDFQGYGVQFVYLYDFGDGWRHLVRLEKPIMLEAVPKFATCSAGARARPPEDVGGTSGYERFLEILADPDDQEYVDTKRWCGGHFDPEWFDLDQINKDLRNALRSNARRPLTQPKPKQPKS